MFKISGVYCASLTPVNNDLSINNDLYLRHCQSLMHKGLDGLTLFGTNGEASSFSIDQKKEAIQFLLNNKIDPKILLPGTGASSLQDAINMTKFCVEIGTKAVLVLPPYYFKNVSDDGIIKYYRNVIEESGDNNFKFLLYNIPQHSGVTISFSIIETLLKLYPNNVVGMKDSSGDLDNMLKITKFFSGFSLFSGSDSLALKVMKHGGAGAITASSNISGKLLSFIINNYKKESSIKNFQELQLLQEHIRHTLFSQEPISVLKGYMAVRYDKQEWNRLNPPLHKIDNPHSNKVIINLLELIKKIDELIPTS